MCPECGHPLVIRDRRPPFYGCSSFPDCGARYPANEDGSLVRVPVDKATRKARVEAHRVFDQLWKGKHRLHPKQIKARQKAYSWLRQTLGLSRSQAHIHQLSIEQCEKLKNLVYRDHPNLHDSSFSRLIYSPFDDPS